MNRLKLAIAGVLAAALVVTSLPLQAFATDKPPIKRFQTASTEVVKEAEDSEPTSLKNFVQVLQDEKAWTNNDKEQVRRHINDYYGSFRKALDNGDWVKLQQQQDSGAMSMRYCWSETKLTTAVLHYRDGQINGATYDAEYRVKLDYQKERFTCLTIYKYKGKSAISAGRISDARTSELVISRGAKQSGSIGTRIATLLATFDYTKSEELKHYNITIPKTIDGPRQPEFAWNINEKGELFVTYMKNDQKLNSYLDYCKARWVINEVSADYKTVFREGVFNDLVRISIYSYQFEVRGFYNLRITIECNIHPPLLPYDHSYIYPITFNIPFDGNYHRGSTFRHCDSDNNCAPEPIDCNQLTGIARTACNMNTHFNFGVLNPSLLAMRSLVSSFLVPAEPTCGIAIPAVGNKVVDSYSPSKAIDQACRLSAEIRPKFPLFVVFTNFVVALFLLWLLVRAINNLLDHRQDDVVGGM